MIQCRKTCRVFLIIFLCNFALKTIKIYVNVPSVQHRNEVALHMKTHETETTFTHDRSEATHFRAEGKFAENDFLNVLSSRYF